MARMSLLSILVLVAVAMSGCMEKGPNDAGPGGAEMGVEELKNLSIQAAENLSSYRMKSSVIQTTSFDDFRINVTPEFHGMKAIENLGDENLSANVTVTLPPGISFINSTSRHENISPDTYGWFINRLDPERRRTISFMARAENDGFYVSNASIIARSRDDGREISSANVIAQVVVGKTVYSITPTFWQDWCPCDENLLGRLSWNEASVKSGKDLGCLC